MKEQNWSGDVKSFFDKQSESTSTECKSFLMFSLLNHIKGWAWECGCSNDPFAVRYTAQLVWHLLPLHDFPLGRDSNTFAFRTSWLSFSPPFRFNSQSITTNRLPSRITFTTVRWTNFSLVSVLLENQLTTWVRFVSLEKKMSCLFICLWLVINLHSRAHNRQKVDFLSSPSTMDK